jgi:hypothetical protein
MKRFSALLPATLIALGLATTAGTAQGFEVKGTIDGEQAFTNLGASIDFAAEGRWGDRGGAAEHEFNFHYDNGSGGQVVPTQYRAYDWGNGQGTDWTISLENGVMTYLIGGQTLTYNASSYDFNDAFIRTTARDAGNSIVVDNLTYNGAAIGATSSFACTTSGGCDYWNSSEYLWLADLGDAFTLSGTTTMNWQGEPTPLRSKLAFQVKFGDGPDTPDEETSVPEPALSLLSLSAIGLSLKKLRRRSA